MTAAHLAAAIAREEAHAARRAGRLAARRPAPPRTKIEEAARRALPYPGPATPDAYARIAAAHLAAHAASTPAQEPTP